MGSADGGIRRARPHCRSAECVARNLPGVIFSTSAASRRPIGRMAKPKRSSASVITERKTLAAACSASQASTPGSGSERINSETTLVSNRIIAKPSIELRRFSHRLARWYVQRHAAQGRETRAYGLGQIGWWCGLTGERCAQDAARRRHRVTVLGRPDAKLLLQSIVEFTNRDARRDVLLLFCG